MLCIGWCHQHRLQRPVPVEIDGVVLKEGDFPPSTEPTDMYMPEKFQTQPAKLSGDFCRTDGTLRQICPPESPYQCRHARTRQDARGFGASRYRSVPYGTHVLRRRKDCGYARNDSGQNDVEGRKKALDKLLPYQKADFKEIFKTMDGLPVNVRLLDLRLHEFVPHDLKGQEEMAQAMGVTVEYIRQRVESLCEHNPMLGHRGCREIRIRKSPKCRLALSWVRSRTEEEGYDPHPEIMVPLIGILWIQKHRKRWSVKLLPNCSGRRRGNSVQGWEPWLKFPACSLDCRPHCFMPNTSHSVQTTWLRWPSVTLATISLPSLPVYLEKKILKVDPFQVLDQNGVGQLIKMAVAKGRSVRPALKCGICGEHGGEPMSVKFCHKVGLIVSAHRSGVPIKTGCGAKAIEE